MCGRGAVSSAAVAAAVLGARGHFVRLHHGDRRVGEPRSLFPDYCRSAAHEDDSDTERVASLSGVFSLRAAVRSFASVPCCPLKHPGIAGPPPRMRTARRRPAPRVRAAWPRPSRMRTAALRRRHAPPACARPSGTLFPPPHAHARCWPPYSACAAPSPPPRGHACVPPTAATPVTVRTRGDSLGHKTLHIFLSLCTHSYKIIIG